MLSRMGNMAEGCVMDRFLPHSLPEVINNNPGNNTTIVYDIGILLWQQVSVFL